MGETFNSSPELFYDPFTEKDGEELFDPVSAHASMWERYSNQAVEHDYTADKFLADTQALMMDAQFLGRFEEAQIIAMQIHQLCGEDHSLSQSLQSNESFGSYLDSFGSQSHDGHSHDIEHGHDRDEDDDEKSKKKKKRRPRTSWLRRS